jgi:hypothetical protein
MTDEARSVRQAPRGDRVDLLAVLEGERAAAVRNRAKLKDRPDRSTVCDISKVPSPDASQAECRRFDSGHPLSRLISEAATPAADNDDGRAIRGSARATAGGTAGNRNRSNPQPRTDNPHAGASRKGCGLRVHRRRGGDA